MQKCLVQAGKNPFLLAHGLFFAALSTDAANRWFADGSGMEQAVYLITLVSTALIVAAAFSSLIAFRFGAPLLLLFLGIGLASVRRVQAGWNA